MLLAETSAVSNSAPMFQLLAVALGSGLTVKIADIVYEEFKKRRARASEKSEFIDHRIDPFLKSLDEIVGKLRSLAVADFKQLKSCEKQLADGSYPTELASLLYLMTGFWAQIELLRRAGLLIGAETDERWDQLHSFIRCLESKRIRLVDRGTQRACAELTLCGKGNSDQKIPYVAYANGLSSDPDFRFWMRGVTKQFAGVGSRATRQNILLYGVVLHAMLDTLDSTHRVTKDRPAFPNKLTTRTRRDLRYRVFGRHLQGVKNPSKYFERK